MRDESYADLLFWISVIVICIFRVIRLANDVIVVPITTTLRSSPTHAELAEKEGGLDKPSMVKCEQITTLDKSLLIRGPFSGTISPIKMAEIEKAIQRAVGIVI